LVKVVAILGVIKPCTCNYTRTLRFLTPADAYILTHLVNLAFGLQNYMSSSGFKVRPVYNSGFVCLAIQTTNTAPS